MSEWPLGWFAGGFQAAGCTRAVFSVKGGVQGRGVLRWRIHKTTCKSGKLGYRISNLELRVSFSGGIIISK